MSHQLSLGLEPGAPAPEPARPEPAPIHRATWRPAPWTPPEGWDDARRRALAIRARLWRGESGLTLEAPDKTRRVFAVGEWPAVLAALEQMEDQPC